MKLTIGMIVKNEEKWLDKCLSCIKPILDKVDSELIITDTGSDDRTVEIASKYTDNVLHFEWINDFSAARNSGLEKANGEWFMFLDADEIFENCNGIISFFNSDEYKNYNSAVFICRNLHNINDLSDYSDMQAPRLVKLLPETRFNNLVHECLNTFGEPIKNIDDVAIHYGYAYDDKENILEKKQERNSELLLKRLEIEGDTNELLYVQLFECFSAKFDHIKAYEYLEKGRELCIRKSSIVLVVIYSAKARLEFRNGHYKEVLDICSQYFSMDKRIRPHILTSDAEMYYLKAMSLIQLDYENEAFPALCGLFDIYTDVISGKLMTDDAYLQSYEFATENNYVKMLCVFISCCIKTGRCDVAEKYMNSVSTEIISKSKDIYAKRKLELSLTALKLADENTDISYLIGAAVEEKVYKTDKIKLLNHITDIHENDIIEFAEKYSISESPDIIAVMIKKGHDITSLFNDNIDLKTCALECCKYIAGFYELLENYAAESIRNKDKLPAAADFIGLCISIRLVENENKPKEYKEKIIEKLFILKNNINALYKKYNAANEFARLALTVKQNIRAYIANGNIESARKAIEDYRKIAPHDPETDELYKMTQVEK